MKNPEVPTRGPSEDSGHDDGLPTPEEMREETEIRQKLEHIAKERDRLRYRIDVLNKDEQDLLAELEEIHKNRRGKD